jgi:23S rRNA pseudouridine1911/1915/1917 synthase
LTVEKFHFTVPTELRRTRLEDYLCGALTTLSRMYLRSLIRDQKVEVNGICENAGCKLRPGDFVEVEADMSRGTSMVPQDIPLEIVFEDADVVVVDKPAGMLVHPSNREKTGTLLNALTYYLNRDGDRFVRPGLVHRLDKATSGLIVVAKSKRAHRILARSFMKKRVEKRYSALVEGILVQDEGTIEAPIGRHADRKHWSVKEGGKISQTRFWVVERRDDTTLIELEPVTGRTNQLRIHCESVGHPIVGDTRRGGREFKRLCLHASKLSFPHPSTNEVLTFTCPSPFS